MYTLIPLDVKVQNCDGILCIMLMIDFALLALLNLDLKDLKKKKKKAAYLRHLISQFGQDIFIILSWLT